MFRITKAERDYLLEHGLKYHRDIHATHNHNNNTYATENEKVYTLLKQFMNEKLDRDKKEK